MISHESAFKAANLPVEYELYSVGGQSIFPLYRTGDCLSSLSYLCLMRRGPGRPIRGFDGEALPIYPQVKDCGNGWWLAGLQCSELTDEQWLTNAIVEASKLMATYK